MVSDQVMRQLLWIPLDWWGHVQQGKVLVAGNVDGIQGIRRKC